ncbi:hypothetical protein PIB30_011424 [Stylosanthes scabra]|uniref:Uncharacterized protein n=1 Tax=Stylosanthes scabra TaxID=79078 RepID=A0ABU6Q5M2_9FABA|nr:hypothetical protein [Stylosanthes scabra]
MLGSSSLAFGSYSRSRSHGSFARSRNRARSGKVPWWCNCGMRLVLCCSRKVQRDPSLDAKIIIQMGRGGVASFKCANFEENDGMVGKYDSQDGTDFAKKI